MTLNIISAEKVEFTGEVSKVTMPGALGLFTVLENHAALISSLVAGKMVYTVDGKDEEMEIKDGIADINHNVVSVCLY
ncbi:MAG: F0F1 ATP synthase subunit epsilon [Muribaculaceae bacterium]|nr:F0F1 ATP synthase subunit epsilon [Muribaculaceae bacterium]